MKRTFSIGLAALCLAVTAAAQQPQQNTQSASSQNGSAASQQGQSTPAKAAQTPAPQEPSAATGQKTGQAQQGSLADAARKARENKKGESQTPKVWDNDNIPSTQGTLNVVGSAKEASTSGDKAGSGAASGNDETTWRKRFAEARAKIADDQQNLDLLQRDMGRLDVQYYSDPVKAEQQQYSRGDINNQKAKIDAAQKKLATDRQALSDMEEELRKSGGDPGWARE